MGEEKFGGQSRQEVNAGVELTGDRQAGRQVFKVPPSRRQQSEVTVADGHAIKIREDIYPRRAVWEKKASSCGSCTIIKLTYAPADEGEGGVGGRGRPPFLSGVLG